ncbi:MAG: VanZ family protein [Sphingobacteriales bacterium]|nr:VanZ family protein [Sphingobacteriales bacterium]
MFRTLKYQLPAIAWAILVLILCLLPPQDLPRENHFFEGFDKIVHLGFFFTLTVLLFFGKIRQQNSYDYRILTVLKIVLVNIAIGGGIELLQWKVFISRDGDWWDFFADMIGLGMGVFGYLLLHRNAWIKPKN